MKQLNLLPQSQLAELKLRLASQQFLKFFLVVISTLVLFFAAAFALSFYLQGSIQESNAKISQLQAQLSSSNNKALEKQVLALNTQINNVKNLQKQHYYWSDALGELGNLAPAGFHLNFMTADRASGKITLEGVSDQREDVILFWSKVKRSGYFKDIDFPLNNLERATDTPFTFTFYINSDKITKR